MHFFVCHLPSRRGGAAESEWKRDQAKRVLQSAIDSILTTDKNAQIIVMGDMNGAPKDDLNGLKNPMAKVNANAVHGTHKYHGRWTYLDQFYLSPALDSLSQTSVFAPDWLLEPDEKYMGLQPKRTYDGFHYRNGYSDHLPIVLRIATDTASTSASYESR